MTVSSRPVRTPAVVVWLVCYLGMLSVQAFAGRPDQSPQQTQRQASTGAQLSFASIANLHIPKVSTPPRLDDFLHNRPREAEAVVSDFRQREPGDGDPIREATSAYLSYDDKNLYAVFVCAGEPQRIRAHMSKREDIEEDDRVSIYLDTFHDHRRAYVFSVNPFGIQRDGILSESDGGEVDYSFDTLWYSEGRLTEHGFVVWIALPFKSLRFSRAEVQGWGIAVSRTSVFTNEEAFWPYITNRIQSLTRQMGTLSGLDRISPGRNIQMIPYGAFTQSRFLDTEANPVAFRHEQKGRAGLDSKLVLSNALALDFTVNPDFSEVESDDPQQIINQRFEVFFPEKRPFFLENSDFLRTPIRLFYTRRIVHPEFGARISGKVGGWTIAGLGIDDRAPGETLPPGDPLFKEHAVIGIARLVRDIGSHSTVGMFASNYHFGNTSNLVAGLDTRIQFSPNWRFTGQVVRSSTQETPTRTDGNAYYAELAGSGRHFSYSGTYDDFSPQFASQLGFIQRTDIRRTQQYLGYLWRPEGRTVISFGPSIGGVVDWDYRGRMQDWLVTPEFSVLATRSTQLKFGHTESLEVFDDLRFRKNSSSGTFSSQWLPWLGLSVYYDQGTEVNYSPAPGLKPFLADSRNGTATLSLRPTKRFLFEQTYIYSRLGVRDGTMNARQGVSTVFTDHLFRSKINYQFTKALSVRAILDYDAVLPNPSLVALETQKRVVPDLLITYQLNPGTAVYVGYTEGYENLALHQTGLFRTSSPFNFLNRQIFVKLTYLLRF